MYVFWFCLREDGTVMRKMGVVSFRRGGLSISAFLGWP